MSVRERNNVKISGRGTQPMIFAHGFGCDQNMWRFVAPAFEDDYQVVLYDQVGAGKSDLSAYTRAKYARLEGYVSDLLEICAVEGLTDVIFVGHSVSAMIGVLAAIRRPDLFQRLILIGPSPCYINDADYVGGFSREDIGGMLEFLDSNHMGWSSVMAPVIMGNPQRPELASELSSSFCRTDPDIARHFARVTFLSDNRTDLSKVATPALILQCSDDAIAPTVVGEYVHAHLSDSRLVMLDATGHCPNLSAPDKTIAAMKAYLQQ
jgi:sigma-B regulation protein RsbQ